MTDDRASELVTLSFDRVLHDLNACLPASPPPFRFLSLLHVVRSLFLVSLSFLADIDCEKVKKNYELVS